MEAGVGDGDSAFRGVWSLGRASHRGSPVVGIIEAHPLISQKESGHVCSASQSRKKQCWTGKNPESSTFYSLQAHVFRALQVREVSLMNFIIIVIKIHGPKPKIS